MNGHRLTSVTAWTGDAANPPTMGLVKPYRSTKILGLAGTIILHAIVWQSVSLGMRAHKVHKPEREGLGATQLKTDFTGADTLVLLDMPAVEPNNEPLREDLASAGTVPHQSLITILSPDPLPHVDIDASSIDSHEDAAVDSGDPAARVALFGRYTGQIDARIERAWQHPRFSVDPGQTVSAEAAQAKRDHDPADVSFECRVRIIQDNRGLVQEVQLLKCSDDPVWRQSLVTAIFASSPLPAPPSPAVFTQAITLSFEGRANAVGSSVDE